MPLTVAADKDPLLRQSLQPDLNRRTATTRVAGIAALLIAKAYKIDDRLTAPSPGREADKDAGDVIRLLLTADPDHVGQRIQTLLNDERTARHDHRGPGQAPPALQGPPHPRHRRGRRSPRRQRATRGHHPGYPAAFLAALPLPT